MAAPCRVIISPKLAKVLNLEPNQDLSYKEWVSILQDGGLDTLLKDAIVSLEQAEVKAEKPTEAKEASEQERMRQPKNAKDVALIYRNMYNFSPMESVLAARLFDAKAAFISMAKGMSKEDYYKQYWFGGEQKGGLKQMSLPDGRKVTVKPIGAEVVDGFYSNTENALSQVKQEKMSGNQWMTQLLSRGGNKEEMTWTGLQDYLKENAAKSISKADIQNFLKDNRISVNEVVKGEGAMLNDEWKAGAEENKGTGRIWKNRGWKVVENSKNSYSIFYPDGTQMSGDWATKDGAFGRVKMEAPNGTTKFSQYQLEGDKSNYKEVLVTMPPTKEKLSEIEQKALEAKSAEELAEKMFKDNTGIKLSEDAKESGYEDNDGSIQQAALTLAMYNEGRGDFYGRKQLEDRLRYLVGDSYEQAKKLGEDVNRAFNEANKKRAEKVEGVFKSTHYDEPNILVHLRMNTRTDADGNKVLFLEEVQSDFQQEYRKQQSAIDDYVDKNSAKVIEAFKKKGILEVICP